MTTTPRFSELVIAWRKDSNLITRFSRILGVNALNNLVAFLVTILGARLFGPAAFGVFALAVTVAMLGAAALNMGQHLALVQVHDRKTDIVHQQVTIRMALHTQLAVMFGVAILALPAAWSLAVFMPLLSDYVPLTALAVITAALLSMWKTMRGIDQARRDFRTFERQIAIYAIFRAALSSIGLVLLSPTPFTLFITLYPLPLACVLVFSWFTRYRQHHQPVEGVFREQERSVRAMIVRYGGWVGLSTLLYTALFRIPQLALAHRGEAVENGVFSAALTFIAVLTLLNQSIRTLLLPHITSLRSPESRRAFRRKFNVMAPLGFVGLSMIVIVMAAFLYVVLGEEYRESVPAFLVLGLAIVLGLYFGLQNMLVHAHSIPHLGTYVTLGQVVVLALLVMTVPARALPLTTALANTIVLGEIVFYYLLRRHEAKVTTHASPT